MGCGVANHFILAGVNNVIYRFLDGLPACLFIRSVGPVLCDVSVAVIPQSGVLITVCVSAFISRVLNHHGDNSAKHLTSIICIGYMMENE